MSTRALIDKFGRSIEYLRLSVTDRCNLRCTYCRPGRSCQSISEAGSLSFDEIERVVGLLVRSGVSRVRLTGGEPLIRPRLPALAARLSRLTGLEDLSISSNCVRMDAMADQLYRAGVRRLNVSLDSLVPEVFRRITGGNLAKVLRGIAAAKAAGFHPIKVNTVVMRGVNDDEVESIIEYCATLGCTLRLIETMPMGTQRAVADTQFVDLREIRRRLALRYELVPDVMPGGGPARYFRLAGTDIRVGFITPLSQHFCQTCNRVRLSAAGELWLCLGQESGWSLGPLLRGGASDEELEARIRLAIARKPEMHRFLDASTRRLPVMSRVGG
jgi:cyclic pyranopterin phosphate synthase